jgi:23S rRNA (uracil1939-C5)-methyltransferase
MPDASTLFADMQVGDEITIEAGELVAGGAAMARVDGFPLFIENVFPGDIAAVRLVEVKKSFGRGELVRLISPSPLRRTEPCPIAGECGGCDWTALRLDAQLRARERILIESLRRIGKLDVALLPPIAIHPSPLNYRIRSRLHRDDEAIGFYATRSNRVVPLSPECEVVGLETARTFGARVGPASSRPPGGGEAPKTHNDPEDQNPPASRPSATPTGDDRDARDDIPRDEIWELGGRLVSGEHDLTVHVDRYTFHASTGTFFQVNRHLLSTMLRLVAAHAARVSTRRAAIDLYAGVGFFSVPLAESFERVVSVEGSLVSHRYAKRNVPPKVKLVHAPVERYRMPSADLVFLDPPRAGARPEVIDRIAAKAREMICYLSCDPVTFARDAARLTASGWRLSTLDLLDLFPNTHHVETLSSFERAPQHR